MGGWYGNIDYACFGNTWACEIFILSSERPFEGRAKFVDDSLG